MMAGFAGQHYYHRLKPDKQSGITDNFRVSLTGEVVGVAGRLCDDPSSGQLKTIWF